MFRMLLTLVVAGIAVTGVTLGTLSFKIIHIGNELAPHYFWIPLPDSACKQIERFALQQWTVLQSQQTLDKKLRVCLVEEVIEICPRFIENQIPINKI